MHRTNAERRRPAAGHRPPLLGLRGPGGRDSNAHKPTRIKHVHLKNIRDALCATGPHSPRCLSFEEFVRAGLVTVPGDRTGGGTPLPGGPQGPGDPSSTKAGSSSRPSRTPPRPAPAAAPTPSWPATTSGGCRPVTTYATPKFEPEPVDADSTTGTRSRPSTSTATARPTWSPLASAPARSSGMRILPGSGRLIHGSIGRSRWTRPTSPGTARRDLVICHDYARRCSTRRPPWEDLLAAEPRLLRRRGGVGYVHRERPRLDAPAPPRPLHGSGARRQVLAAPVVGPKDGEAALHEPIRVLLYRRPEDVLGAESWVGEVVDDSSFRVIHAMAVGALRRVRARGASTRSLFASEEGLSWFGLDEDGSTGAIERLGEGRSPGGVRAPDTRAAATSRSGRIAGRPLRLHRGDRALPRQRSRRLHAGGPR